MVVDCEKVWLEISDYIDGDGDPSLRSAMEEHFQTCKNCSSVLAGTRNLLELFGDERMMEVPFGFSQRLQNRLRENSRSSRRSFFGWMVTAAAAVLVAGTFEIGRAAGMKQNGSRSEHARTASGIPPELRVIVSNAGKTFHVAGCEFIHDKARLRTIAASEALREGYVPCVRCLGQYAVGKWGA